MRLIFVLGLACGGSAEKDNLCLYGYANEAWEVALPAEEVPPEMPEPALGINFARDGMKRRDWLSLVAVHSDAWLFSVAFFFAARLNGNDRCSSFLCYGCYTPLLQIGKVAMLCCVEFPASVPRV